jgi:hypothetical protein
MTILTSTDLAASSYPNTITVLANRPSVTFLEQGALTGGTNAPTERRAIGGGVHPLV